MLVWRTLKWMIIMILIIIIIIIIIITTFQWWYRQIICVKKIRARELLGIEDSVEASIWRFKYNIKSVKEDWLQRAETIQTTKRLTKQKLEKQLYGYFNRQANKILLENIWTWLRKGNCKREIVSPLISAQNNAIRTNYIKAKLDKTQLNSKCRLCNDRNETINHIKSECSKLAQKGY